MMRTLMDSHQQSSSNINVKINSMYNELNGRIETLINHIRMLDNQAAQSAAGVRAPPGVLLGKLEENPREFMHAITLRSGKGYEGPKWPDGTGPSANQTDQSAEDSNPRWDPGTDRSPAQTNRSITNNAPTSPRVNPFDVEISMRS